MCVYMGGIFSSGLRLYGPSKCCEVLAVDVVYLGGGSKPGVSLSNPGFVHGSITHDVVTGKHGFVTGCHG